MLMPKATMHKDDLSQSREDYVGSTRQIGTVDSEPVAQTVR